MNSSELYKRKYQYELFIKNLKNCLSKLDSCYSNLLLCKKKIGNCITVDDQYYSYNDYEKIIKTIDNNRNKIRNTILPQANYQYKKILSEINNL